MHGSETAGPVLLERRTTLEPTLGSPQVARRLLRQFIEELGRPDWLDAGELAISEVVTNAALHGHTTMEVRLVAYEDRAYVEVKDFNATVPVQRHYDGDATTGRGMALVSALTAECGVMSFGDEGKVVWFRLGGPKTNGYSHLSGIEITSALFRWRHSALRTVFREPGGGASWVALSQRSTS